MTDDEVRRTIDELERALTREAIEEVEHGLARDDPAFVRRVRNHCRAEMATAMSVFLLLATGAVLMTVGLATPSWPTWLAGILAFLASFGANALHERTLHRSP
jgi:Protein of unknown function (DUF3040)